jgi:hypothetical protein
MKNPALKTVEPDINGEIVCVKPGKTLCKKAGEEEL